MAGVLSAALAGQQQCQVQRLARRPRSGLQPDQYGTIVRTLINKAHVA
jgi:hypothetical protein